MAIRKILLPISSAAAGESALATAFVAAKIWGAHVAALHVHVDARDVAPLAGEGLSGAMIEEMMAATEKESSERATTIRSLFDRALAEYGIKLAEPRSTEPRSAERVATASFTMATGREEELVAQQARLADVTVVARPEVEGETASADALHAVLFDSGRPVLLAPPEPPAVIGRRICLAWNGTAEAASAVTAALPWLQEAEAVAILSAEGYQRRGPSAQELAPYLALHGVIAQIRMFGPVDGVVGAGLLAAAAAFEADFLAMGAYSHSRLRQLILGGVTRHVLEHGRLPILMNR